MAWRVGPSGGISRGTGRRDIRWLPGTAAPKVGRDNAPQNTDLQNTDLQNTALENDLVYGHGLPWQGGGHWRRTLPVLTSCMTVR
jgi:hypothetical protein